MDLATLLYVAIRVSIVLTVFTLGLGATTTDVGHLLHRLRRLVRSLVAMNVLMPLLATGLAAAFPLHPAAKIALVALAVSPVPPVLPSRQP
jgi:bile acid:Na+ symporter, BASS family